MKYLIILLWLILGIIYFWFWDKGKTNCCDENGLAIESKMLVNDDPSDTKILEKPSLPLAFKWGSPLTIRGDGFQAYKDSLISALKDDEIMEITGYYRLSEENTTGEENLGLARAKEIRKLLPEIPDEKIRLLSATINEKPGDKTELFGSAAFNNALNQKQVKEIANTAMIYFPSNSVNKLKSDEIEAYLDDVAEAVKGSGQKVLLTGHSDDVGPDQPNLVLSQKRADMIKAYLLKQGVPAEQIISESKGEREPFVPNTSRENRAKNRRVELKIIK